MIPMNHQHLEVWAPFATQVAAVASGQTIDLIPDSSRKGRWRSEAAFRPGTRYGFFLDGEGPLPDPRARSQPDGMHGLSCLIDHALFLWSDADWSPPAWQKAVVYELHVGTFSEEGTFIGAIAHLEHLVNLGVTHVELLPVCEFPGSRNWGYDGVSIDSPHHLYGGPDGLKTLIDACHSVGLAVIIDVVYNHMGHEGNYLPRFGPYFEGPPTPWGHGATMEGECSGEVRAFFIDNALMWLRDYHADGLRLDAIDKIVDHSPKHLLVELREAVDHLIAETYPRVLIAESAANDPIFVRPLAEGGYGMDSQWADDIHHSLRTFLTGERQGYYVDFGGIEDLGKALRQGFVYDGRFSEHRGKVHGKSPLGLPPSTFMAYLQNHDQIGNRPQGDRFHHASDDRLILQKIGSALVLLSPFTPMIFMGEEWAASTPFLFFSDHQDPELAAKVGEGRKKEFGGKEWEGDVPDPQDPECFSRSKLRWDERLEENHRGMLGWYSQLIRLRRSNGPALEMAGVEIDGNGKWLRMRSGHYTVVAAFTKEQVTTPFVMTSAFAAILSAGPVRTNPSGTLEFDGPGVIILNSEP